MRSKKELLAQDTQIVSVDDDLVVEKNATIHVGPQPRLEAHGKSKLLARKSISIGRDKRNAVIIADVKVSRFHAVVSFKQGQAVMTDFGSSNGTTVNGVLVKANQGHILKDRDLIVVGSTQLRIRY